MKRSDNEEKWKPIPDYENDYLVSNYGNIKSLRSKKLLKPNKIHNYLHVHLYKEKKKKLFKIHRLVLYVFVGIKSNEVNHIDGNKQNNKLMNLEFSTRSKNMKHAYALGLRCQKGTNNNQSKFTQHQIQEIKEMLKKKYKNIEIANRFNVCPTVISHIKRGHTYAEK
jgi:hypothetical protein